eukprot:6166427-Pyramimonas_sp.AAC.1
MVLAAGEMHTSKRCQEKIRSAPDIEQSAARTRHGTGRTCARRTAQRGRGSPRARAPAGRGAEGAKCPAAK